MPDKFELPTFEMDGAGGKPARRSAFSDLLEQSKLSHLPKLPRREPCANCGKSLDPNDEYQTAVKLCRECLKNYAAIGEILDRHAERKIRRNYLEAK